MHVVALRSARPPAHLPVPSISPHYSLRRPAACSLPNPDASSCSVVRDYLRLISKARALGVGGKEPRVAIMTPPPLWRDSVYGMNQTVLNDIMPVAAVSWSINARVRSAVLFREM